MTCTAVRPPVPRRLHDLLGGGHGRQRCKRRRDGLANSDGQCIDQRIGLDRGSTRCGERDALANLAGDPGQRKLGRCSAVRATVSDGQNMSTSMTVENVTQVVDAPPTWYGPHASGVDPSGWNNASFLPNKPPPGLYRHLPSVLTACVLDADYRLDSPAPVFMTNRGTLGNVTLRPTVRHPPLLLHDHADAGARKRFGRRGIGSEDLDRVPPPPAHPPRGRPSTGGFDFG